MKALRVVMLNGFLTERRELLNQTESINERSFEIWGQENFKEAWNEDSKNCGISPDFELLQLYEPMTCYTIQREVLQICYIARK